MKKTLLLFAMLLGVVGAWAQVVTPTPGAYYYIQSVSNSEYLSTKNRGTSDWNLTVVDNQTDAGIYELIASGDKYKLRCINPFNGDCYIRKTGSTNFHLSNNNDTNFSLEEQDGSFYISADKYLSMGDGIVANESSKANATKWQFVPVVPIQTYVIDNFNAAYTTWTKYDGTTLTSGWGYKVVHNATNITIQRIGTTNDLGWSTKENGIRYPYLVRGKEYKLTVPEKIRILGYSIETASEKNYTGDVSYTLANNEITITLPSATADANDGGVTIRNITLSYIEREDCKFILTDNAGNQYQGIYSAFYGVEEPTLTGSPYELSNKQWNEGTFTATITFPFPVSKKNGVTKPTMISSFKGDSHQADGSFLWYADNGIVKIKKHVELNNNGRKVASEKNIISYLWALYPKCENGVFSVGIWNIGAGNYISFEKEYDSGKGSANEAEDLKLDNGNVTQFNVAANNAFYHTINGKEHRLSFGSIDNTSGNLGVYVKDHAGTYNSFHIPAITTQISDAKYSTICLPFAANLPEGVEAYSIETVNATYATLTSKEGLPANTGAILKAEPGYYTFTQTEEEIDTWDDNLLYGSVEDIYWYGDGYVLSKKNGVVALYKGELNYILKDGVPEKVASGGKYFKNNAGKALLPTTSLIADARFLVFSFGDGEETGITETENGNVKTENDEVYDLSGRRVQGAQKGIFIVNGKKVVR